MLRVRMVLTCADCACDHSVRCSPEANGRLGPHGPFACDVQAVRLPSPSPPITPTAPLHPLYGCLRPKSLYSYWVLSCDVNFRVDVA